MSLTGTDHGDAALQLFDSLSRMRDIDELIADGEAEGLHLECKATVSPRLNREQKVALARAISGFGNTSGGVLIWGVSTTRHAHSGLDVLSQVEPIASVRAFERQIRQAIPSLTTPAVLRSRTKTLQRRPSETRGVAITYLPATTGDPIQSALDNLFYFRAGDEFVTAPYELIKRLFASTESPDLHPIFDVRLAKRDANGVWTIPIAIENRASAVAEHCKIAVSFGGASACETITCQGFRDASDLNPDEKLFWGEPEGVIHKGIHHVIGVMHVKMKVGKRAKQRLDLEIQLYANKMRAKKTRIALKLTQSGMKSRVSEDGYLY